MNNQIMIVEDNLQIAKILYAYMQPTFNCVYFSNPIPAIEWLMAGNVPDLILSDIRMPFMRGDEFLNYIKSNEFFSKIPVVMLSSEDSTSERIRLLEAGAADYIVKPFNPMELKVRLMKHLQD